MASEDAPELFHALVQLLMRLTQSIAQILHGGGQQFTAYLPEVLQEGSSSLEASFAPSASRFHNSHARHEKACRSVRT